jgi:hypothetical protein
MRRSLNLATWRKPPRGFFHGMYFMPAWVAVAAYDDRFAGDRRIKADDDAARARPAFLPLASRR